jgi:hypothetical protein
LVLFRYFVSCMKDFSSDIFLKSRRFYTHIL